MASKIPAEDDGGDERALSLSASPATRAALAHRLSATSASPMRLVATANAANVAPPRPPLFVKTSESPSPSAQSERTRHAHARKVTRDIAALDFLQNIPMRAEQPPAATRLHHLHHHHHNSSADVDSAVAHDGSHTNLKTNAARVSSSSSSSSEDDAARQNGGESSAGRRLPGFDATIVHVPPLFRYRLTTKFPAASAVVRRWEGMTAQQGLLGSRAYLSSGCGYPVATTTIIKYNGNETSAVRKRFASVGNLEPLSYDWRGKSYFRLLHATWAPCDRDRDSEEDHPVPAVYLPNYLDDPEFRQGRHRHVVRGDKNIGPVVSSILLFVKPNDLKEVRLCELNKKFREKHTWLNGDLSLSKIRNLKRETLASCQRLNLEVATVAMACVYFEKLVLSHFVNKGNRKLYMAACLLLAAKFNEPKASAAMKTGIKQILAEIDQVHSLPSREVLTAEFTVYAQLSFSLHVPLSEVQPHFTRLLKHIESNPRKYLDDDVFAAYSTLVLDEKSAQLLRSDAAATRSFDGETHDEGTDLEALLSDDDEHLGGHGDDGDDDDDDDDEGRDPSLFVWNRVSFSQWWARRTASVTSRGPTAGSGSARQTSASMLSSPIRE
ncbi:hypothetical protein PybrP1_003611 [[Pythium] brassicae (nom. inval.)]|nr:hypothetical protein PybrP1_003611 [[Pythium] brassicae (nom. inval.)]